MRQKFKANGERLHKSAALAVAAVRAQAAATDLPICKGLAPAQSCGRPKLASPTDTLPVAHLVHDKDPLTTSARTFELTSPKQLEVRPRAHLGSLIIERLPEHLVIIDVHDNPKKRRKKKLAGAFQVAKFHVP